MEEDRKLSEEALRHTRIEELLYQQDLLKREMMDAKNRLMVPPSSWTYDCKILAFDSTIILLI